MIDKGKLEQDIIAKLKTVYDPEIPVDIWELGLVYEIKIDDEGNTYIKMTFVIDVNISIVNDTVDGK